MNDALSHRKEKRGGSLMDPPLFFNPAICNFQHRDIQESKHSEIQRHDPYADCLLQFSEQHRHEHAAHICRSHLQSDHICSPITAALYFLPKFAGAICWIAG